MAAFVGYIVQANGIAFPWAKVGGVDIPAGLSPPEQWDAMPVEAKWQIILFIGFLEWFSEAAGTHYMRGGTPGAFPKFSDNTGLIPHPMPLNLFDPLGFSKNKSAEQKEAGLVKELNNGRLAQIGILGFISEQRLEGSVPLLKGLVTHYSGETMAPVRKHYRQTSHVKSYPLIICALGLTLHLFFNFFFNFNSSPRKFSY
jgi:hypothetical protein